MLMKQVIKSHNQVALCIQNEQVPTPEKKTLKNCNLASYFAASWCHICYYSEFYYSLGMCVEAQDSNYNMYSYANIRLNIIFKNCKLICMILYHF